MSKLLQYRRSRRTCQTHQRVADDIRVNLGAPVIVIDEIQDDSGRMMALLPQATLRR